MANLLADLGLLVGTGLIVTGIAMRDIPLALVTAGILVLLFTVLASQSAANTDRGED